MTANDHFEKGKELYEAEEYQAALLSFEKAISLNSNSVEYWTEKATVLWKLHRHIEALEACTKAIEINTEYAPAWRRKGILLEDLNLTDEALIAFNKSISLNPKYVLAYVARGIFFGKLNRMEDALLDFNKALDIDSESTNTHVNIGKAYMELGQKDKALEHYNKAIKLGKTDAVTYYNRGVCFKDLNRKEESLADFDNAIDIDPKYASPWQYKAGMKAEEGNYEAAKILFCRAFYLEQSKNDAINLVSILTRASPSTLLAFRVITQLLPPEKYAQNAKLINETFQACTQFVLFQSYHSLFISATTTQLYSLNKWFGVINYWMGDPLSSFDTLKNLTNQDDGADDLMSWYYLILSCNHFAEDVAPFLDSVFDKAMSYCDKVPSTENEKLQQYYAGLILLLDDEKDSSLSCLLPIANDFLPAAFIALSILHEEGPHEQRDEVLDIILQKEEETEDGFLLGIEPHQLDLENNDFEAVFGHACHYFEIEPVLETMRDLVDGEITVNKPFYELWQLSAADHEKASEFIRQYILRNLYDELFSVRKEKLQAIRFRLTQEQFDSLEKQIEEEPRKVRLFIEEMEKGIAKNRLESYFAEHVQEFSLSAEKYFQLIAYYYLQGHLDEYQHFLLETYTVIQNVTKTQLPEHWFAGLKDGMKDSIGGTLGIISGTITSIIIPPEAIPLKVGAGVLTAFAVKAGTATLVELALKWFKENYSKSKPFTDFKADFEQFLAKEKEQLGDNFDKSYPLHGFEEMIYMLKN